MTRHANKVTHRRIMVDALDWHPSGHGAGMQLAVNVKFYGIMDRDGAQEERFRAWCQSTREQYEMLSSRDLDRRWEIITQLAWDRVSEQWWEDANEVARDIDRGVDHWTPYVRHGRLYPPSMGIRKVYFDGVESSGRSGGWCKPQLSGGNHAYRDHCVYEQDVQNFVDRLIPANELGQYDAKWNVEDIMAFIQFTRRIKAMTKTKDIEEWLTSDLTELIDEEIAAYDDDMERNGIGNAAHHTTT